MQRAKLVNMATAVEEMFRKMFSRDDDGPLIKFLCLCFSWSCVTALSAVKGSITKEAWKISKIPEFYERIFFNCFFSDGKLHFKRFVKGRPRSLNCRSPPSSLAETRLLSMNRSITYQKKYTRTFYIFLMPN